MWEPGKQVHLFTIFIVCDKRMQTKTWFQIVPIPLNVSLISRSEQRKQFQGDAGAADTSQHTECPLSTGRDRLPQREHQWKAQRICVWYKARLTQTSWERVRELQMSRWRIDWSTSFTLCIWYLSWIHALGCIFNSVNGSSTKLSAWQREHTPISSLLAGDACTNLCSTDLQMQEI